MLCSRRRKSKHCNILKHKCNKLRQHFAGTTPLGSEKSAIKRIPTQKPQKPSKTQKKPRKSELFEVVAFSYYKDGRSDWTRTSGLLVPNQAHYQAVPHPVLPDLYIISRFFRFVNPFFQKKAFFCCRVTIDVSLQPCIWLRGKRFRGWHCKNGSKGFGNGSGDDNFWQSLRLKRLPDSKRETVLRAFVLRFVKGPEAPVFLLP